MISRRSVWMAFFGFVLVEVVIGCQGADMSPGSAFNSKATGYGAHAYVPPLTIADPPSSAAPVVQRDKGEAQPPRLTDAPRSEPKEVALGVSHGATPADTSVDLDKLHDMVMDRAVHLDSYIVRFRRREVMNGKENPEECIAMKFRTEPWSVHMRWLKPDEAQGREVLYVKGRYENKMHIVVEKGMPLMGGTKQSFALDSTWVKGKSRHEITDAGVHEFVKRFDAIYSACEHGDKHLGTLVVHGETKRPEFEKPMVLVEHVMPPGYEALLPHGGHRFLYFDMAEKLPMLVITHDDHNQEVEYYCYDCLQANVKLDEADFNPANMGAVKK